MVSRGGRACGVGGREVPGPGRSRKVWEPGPGLASRGVLSPFASLGIPGRSGLGAGFVIVSSLWSKQGDGPGQLPDTRRGTLPRCPPSALPLKTQPTPRILVCLRVRAYIIDIRTHVCICVYMSIYVFILGNGSGVGTT